MTEKRFQGVYIKDNMLKLQDKGIVKVFNNERLEELLNELVEENEELKKENNELKGNIINSLQKSRTVKCNCNPCVTEETILDMLLER